MTKICHGRIRGFLRPLEAEVQPLSHLRILAEMLHSNVPHALRTVDGFSATCRIGSAPETRSTDFTSRQSRSSHEHRMRASTDVHVGHTLEAGE